jgi:AcrR family transcriptional regulator
VGKGEQTREAILDRAIQLGSQLGIEGLSIGRLAGALDLSKSGLFAHFASKEALQLETLDRAAGRFIEVVVRPALAEPRGEPRVRALFERWLRWPQAVPQPGGCLFIAAAAELDDRPGPVRDRLAELQRQWLDTIAGAVRLAKREGHFRRSTDPDQFAFELDGITLAFHHASRLVRDSRAAARAGTAFERLLAASRTTRAARAGGGPGE